MSFSPLEIMESEIAHQSLDSNENMAHLRTLEKTLISKRMDFQKEIDRITITRDNLFTRINGRKRNANSSKLASVEKNLKELRLEHKKINSDISDLNKKIECVSQRPENPGQCHHIEKLIETMDAVIIDDRPVDKVLLIDFRSLINGLRNNLIEVENELADQKHLMETHKSENLAALEQIASLKEKLKAKELMSVSLHENGISHKDMLIEMKKFEDANLNNHELSEK